MANAVSEEDRQSKKRTKKHSKRSKRTRQPEESNDDTPLPGPAPVKTKHNKNKKRRRDGSTDSSSEDLSGNSFNNTIRSAKKKKKKDKKRERSQVDDGDIDAFPPGEAEDNEDRSVKKKKKKKSKKKSKRSEDIEVADEKIVSSSAIEFYPDELRNLQLKKNQEEYAEKAKTEATVDTSGQSRGGKQSMKADNITLLLFYQYVEPPWDEDQFQTVYKFVTDNGNKLGITGRMRVAREGLNCTLTGSHDGIRKWCAAMRQFDGGRGRVVNGQKITEFAGTEFKLTDDLPPKQRFPKLHAFEVVEIVNYGLAGSRAPEISKHGGTHLQPADYHKKMCEKDTVIIDVRNHYEANIGRFDPPKGGAQMIDPMMRKSTEFPMWLDRKETKEMLRGKQVLMYCTGGVRCERASALLKQKIETEEDTKELGIKGVFQLQGGIDKYFKEYPTGGLWKGKNYVFDKRFSHAPGAIEAVDRTKKVLGADANTEAENDCGGERIMGKCESCSKPWDMYRGKRRCPTCGVPSLICRDCFEADKAGTVKLGKDIRCDLCVREDIRSKRQLRGREERETKEYEKKLKSKLSDDYAPPMQRKHAVTRKPRANPERITRLFLKNMCARQMDESALIDCLSPARITHIQWLLDKTTGKFYGSAFVEMKTPEDAGSAMALNGSFVLGRKLKVKYEQADAKSVWPIPGTEICVEKTEG